jgi:hypothetical protein
LTGAPACRGCASSSRSALSLSAAALSGVVLSMTVLSGELSVSTDRMIASLRAQEPVRLVDRRRHQPGGRADEALYAPGQLRCPDRSQAPSR